MKTNKILIVDDLQINREILISLLEDDYEILQASDGAKAIDMINEHCNELSLVLLDLVMPVMDGFGVLDYVSNKNLNLPIIVITANNNLEHEKKALSFGAVDFISKPFDNEIVKCRVDTHVKLKNYQTLLEELVQQKIQEIAEMRASFLKSVGFKNLKLGKLIKELRVEKSLTQNQLAEILNVAQSKISSFEHDTSEPDLSTMLKLANTFDVSLDYLCGRKEEKQSFPDSVELSNEEKDILQSCKQLSKENMLIVIGFIKGLLHGQKE